MNAQEEGKRPTYAIEIGWAAPEQLGGESCLLSLLLRRFGWSTLSGTNMSGVTPECLELRRVCLSPVSHHPICLFLAVFP